MAKNNGEVSASGGNIYFPDMDLRTNQGDAFDEILEPTKVNKPYRSVRSRQQGPRVLTQADVGAIVGNAVASAMGAIPQEDSDSSVRLSGE